MWLKPKLCAACDILREVKSTSRANNFNIIVLLATMVNPTAVLILMHILQRHLIFLQKLNVIGVVIIHNTKIPYRRTECEYETSHIIGSSFYYHILTYKSDKPYYRCVCSISVINTTIVQYYIIQVM